MPPSRRKDIKKILTDPVLRRRLMVWTIQAIQAREGIETTEQQAEEAYDAVLNEKGMKARRRAR